MSDTPISKMMETVLEKVQGIVDSNTVIGKPIICGDKTTIVPITKVSMGAGSGGTEWQTKENKSDRAPFGGGSGIGVTVSPVALLIIRDDKTELVNISEKDDSYDKLLGIIPEAVDKIKDLFSKKK